MKRIPSIDPPPSDLCSAFGTVCNPCVPDGTVDVPSVDVRVPHHHCDGLVPADLPNGREIYPGLHKIGYSRVPHDVWRDIDLGGS
jgi:hypothetical protein